ncbi:sulfonate transport system permease protein [Sphingomonas gellani]|uniref:Sulfonate transport system permease protein n=1 Tax=Sphingomonas gellani TaxID=1166340 RepID=A0A1H8GH91_9SPHN|nr:ABC transporter permease [Sphingomonas gellani]SEN42847.1 sulfonate transport system permease protein [Sphingomonas gellani]
MASIDANPEQRRSPRSRRRPAARAGARWFSPLVLLALWEAGSRIGLIPPRTLAAPSAVLATMAGMIASGELGHNVLVSLGRAGLGLAVGVLVGGALAILAGLSRRGEIAIDSPVQMLRTLPTLALTPLFIVWFGIGETPKIVLIAVATTFPVYLNLYNGIRGVDSRLIEAARAFGLSHAAIVRHVVLPGALPALLVGLRYALSISVLILVVAEQINASSGLGYLINNARDFMRTDIIVVCLMVYAALGLGADAAVRLVERRSLAWRPTVLAA